MFREHRYRFRILPLGLAMTAFVLVVSEGFALVGPGTPAFLPFKAEDLLLLGALWVAALVLWALFPSYAGADGLRATDGIGRYHDVRWEEITHVSSLLGFLWVRHGRPGKALTVPRFLADYPGFRSVVLRRAPQGNPLRTYLERH